MRAEEFDNLTEEELQSKANGCFFEAENTLGDDAEKLRLLLTAQFYLTAVAKKRDDRTASRDLRLEYVVIILISVEIILSVVFGFLGLHEGAQQSRILDRMDDSTRTTASAMNGATTALKTLGEEQKTSLVSLAQMDQTLQDSVKQTGAMALATGKQLQILQAEQADRLAQQSKKPKMELYVGAVPLSPSNPSYIPARSQTDTLTVYDLTLLNSGNTTANKGVLRVELLAKDVYMTIEGAQIGEQVQLPPGSPENVYLLHFGDMRPNTRAIIIVTFSFLKGQRQFGVQFSVDADELETGTPLGVMYVTPQKPVS